MSDGVAVYHGRFNEDKKYKMFLGINEPLRRVYYDNRLVFGPRNTPYSKYELFVEVFETKLLYYLKIHCISNLENGNFKYSKAYFQYGNHTYKRITQRKFDNRVNYIIYISIDIGKERTHPFLTRKVDENNPNKHMYKLISRIEGDGNKFIEGQSYTFGSIYDSTRPIVIGYTKMDVFVNSSDYFEVENSDGEILRFINGNSVIEYELRVLMGKVIWYGIITEETILLHNDHVKAYEVKRHVDNCSEEFKVVTLDIAENISPELFGIEKVTGYVGNGRYTMYQLKKEYIGKERIVYVIDTECKNILIDDVRRSIHTSVEVYENHKSKIVIVNIVIDVNGQITREFDVYKKINGNVVFYSLIRGLSKYEVLKNFERLYPIKINVTLDEEENIIVKKREIKLTNGKLILYNIRNIERFKVNNRIKYIFGYVWEKNLYEKGNIPAEEYKNKCIKVKANIKLSNFVVGKYENVLYLDRDNRRSYSIIMI